MTNFNPIKEQLQELIDKNYSSYDIAKHFNKSQGSIRFWLKKHKLKTNFRFREGGWTNKAVHKNLRNWQELQDYYNNNHSWNEVCEQFKISRSIISYACNRKYLISRTHNESMKIWLAKGITHKHTPESKLKLSIARTAYLHNNPEVKPWKNTKDSIPCIKTKELLTKNNIVFIAEFQPLLHLKRFFSIDIAFPDKMIGIEINGGQHYESDGNLKPYYQKRHDLIESQGWKLYEIPYHIAFNEIKMLELINNILNSESKLIFDYLSYKPKQKKVRVLKGYKMKYSYPSTDELRLMAQSMRLQDLEKKLNIPKKALWAYLNDRDIKCKKQSRKLKPSEINPNWKRDNGIKARKVEWPSKEKLKELIISYPMIEIGKMFGVNGNSVKKWCVRYNIELPKYGQGFWAKVKHGKLPHP